MKNRITSIIISLILILTVNVNTFAEELTLNAISGVLIDAGNGRVLYGKNLYEKRPMASTTKIMTCILALEYGNLEDIVTFSSYAASMPKVRLGVNAGEQYRLGDLLYSLMLESHNDTAVAIAEHICGSVEAFAELMNEKAVQLKAMNTNFVTPNGLDADGHYSTAYDMALIGAYAIKNEKFVEITNTKNYSFSELSGKRNVSLINADAFLSMMEGAIGIKTGFTGLAGYCFVGAVSNDEKKFVSVVLGSGWPPNKSYKWRDTQSLMKYGIENYEYKKVFDGVESFNSIEIIDGQQKEVETYIKGKYSMLLAEYEKVSCEAKMKKNILAPVEEGQNVGNLDIKVDGKVVVSFPICTKKNVEKIDFMYCLEKVLNNFFMG